MAWTWSSKAVDPIAYRVEEQQQIEQPVTEKSTDWQFDPSKLQNADVNLSKYWDDSSEANYNNPNLRWGENDKYKWENTKNTSVAYDKNATLENLNPNYAYWQKAQMVNSSDAGYIQRRNDQIASALYNAGKTSIQDVSDYLNQQAGFQNSTENERNNTIASVWKRLWEISSNGNQNENKTDTNKQVEDNSAVKDMESDLLKWTDGKIYWKNTADINWDDSAIKTTQDAYNVERAVNEQRVRNMKDLQAMSSETIAYMMNEWVNTFWDQTMRDLMQYDNNKYQEIQNELKKIRGQNAIDQISIDWKIDLTEQLNKDVDNTNTEMSSFIKKTASERDTDSLTTSLNNVLSESEIVSTARWQMEVYKRKIEEIQSAADSLVADANKKFKSDVPQYLVNAFISNRMQQYNKELQKYQNLYNASLDEAKFEISQAQWREEMDYKRKNQKADQDYKDANLQLQREKFEYDKQVTDETNQITLIKNWKWNNDGSYSYIDGSWKMVNISKQDASNQTSIMLSNNADAFFSIWQQKMDNAQVIWDACYWWQCEAFTDNYANQFYWVTMVWEWHTYTTAEEKAWYVNVFTPYKWAIAVWNFTNWTENMKKYWHTAVVMDYDPVTWDFTFMESNWDWKGTVWIRKANINTDGNLVWFRDPTKPSIEEQEEIYSYDYYANSPMRNIFVEAYENATTKDLKDDINRAEDSYAIFNELWNEWYIDKVANSDEFNALLNDIANGKFSDSDGNITFWEINKKIRNELKDEELSYAFDRFRRLIEKKLRKESWAAISQSEWNSNFDMYLPAIWQTPEYRIKRLQAFEKDIVPWQLPSTYRDKYIPIIQWESKKKSELEDAQNIIIEAMRKQNWNK